MTDLDIADEHGDLPLVTLTPEQLDTLADRVAVQLYSTTWMSSEQVCEWLQIRKDYLYDLVARSQIPHVKLGRLLRFKRSELETWIESFRVQAQS